MVGSAFNTANILNKVDVVQIQDLKGVWFQLAL